MSRIDVTPASSEGTMAVLAAACASKIGATRDGRKQHRTPRLVKYVTMQQFLEQMSNAKPPRKKHHRKSKDKATNELYALLKALRDIDRHDRRERRRKGTKRAVAESRPADTQWVFAPTAAPAFAPQPAPVAPVRKRPSHFVNDVVPGVGSPVSTPGALLACYNAGSAMYSHLPPDGDDSPETIQERRAAKALSRLHRSQQTPTTPDIGGVKTPLLVPTPKSPKSFSVKAMRVFSDAYAGPVDETAAKPEESTCRDTLKSVLSSDDRRREPDVKQSAVGFSSRSVTTSLPPAAETANAEMTTTTAAADDETANAEMTTTTTAADDETANAEMTTSTTAADVKTAGAEMTTTTTAADDETANAEMTTTTADADVKGPETTTVDAVAVTEEPLRCLPTLANPPVRIEPSTSPEARLSPRKPPGLFLNVTNTFSGSSASPSPLDRSRAASISERKNFGLRLNIALSPGVLAPTMADARPAGASDGRVRRPRRRGVTSGGFVYNLEYLSDTNEAFNTKPRTVSPRKSSLPIMRRQLIAMPPPPCTVQRV